MSREYRRAIAVPLRLTVPASCGKVSECSIVKFEPLGGNMNISPFAVPLGAFVMVVIIVAIGSMKKMREKELEAHQQLRTQEMEHERKMKELELEKAKIELEKVRSSKTG
jgi:hypothetical protein